MSVSDGLNGGWWYSGTADPRSSVLVRVWRAIWPLPAWVVGVLVRVPRALSGSTPAVGLCAGLWAAFPPGSLPWYWGRPVRPFLPVWHAV